MDRTRQEFHVRHALPPLDRRQAAAAVLAAKHASGLRWAKLGEIIGRSTGWTTAALLGQHPLTAEQAATLGSALDLDQRVIDALMLAPVRGHDAVDTSEPLVYRLQEMVQVYGFAITDLVREEFGDGIISRRTRAGGHRLPRWGTGGPRPARCAVHSQNCELRVLVADRATATEVRDEVERLVGIHDVFRGAVLSFDVREHRGNQLVSFLPRPELVAADVVLPEGVLDAVERHIVRTPEQAARLTEHGQHLKRGLLLHGPPGTGKTQTLRYLLNRLGTSTVVVLSGRAMHLLPQAAALVRRLQPSVLVIEDVDLIAEDRMRTSPARCCSSCSTGSTGSTPTWT